MAYSTITKPADYFTPNLHTGTGSATSITGLDFQPDLVWVKQRDGTNGNGLYDVIRGATQYIGTDYTGAEATVAGTVTAFNSDGFSVGTHASVNGSSNTYVSWNWLAGGTASSNTDGSITSSVSANTTAGFSIATFTTPSSGTVFDVGHGLGGKPDWMLMKSLGSGNWWTWHIGFGDNTTDYMSFNDAGAEGSAAGMWGTVGAGTSTFGYTAGTSAPISTDTVAYFFKSIKGFSKFGSYIGNGSTDGTFIYTGFKPAFVIIKKTDTSGNFWNMLDNKRDTSNIVDKILYPNSSNAEATGDVLDFLSNGFKQRNSGGNTNGSSGTYIYMAFAENPLVSNTGGGIPATAR